MIFSFSYASMSLFLPIHLEICIHNLRDIRKDKGYLSSRHKALQQRIEYYTCYSTKLDLQKRSLFYCYRLVNKCLVIPLSSELCL